MKYEPYMGKIKITNICDWILLVDRDNNPAGYKTSCNHKILNTKNNLINCPFCDRIVKKRVNIKT